MKLQRIALLLTAVNLIILVFLLAQLHPANGQRQNSTATTAQVLRGRGLEITDSLGRLRASITFEPQTVVNGKTYSAGILLRLRNSKGHPVVKLEALENGSGMVLSDEHEGYVQILANEENNLVRVKTKTAEKVIQP